MTSKRRVPTRRKLAFTLIVLLFCGAEQSFAQSYGLEKSNSLSNADTFTEATALNGQASTLTATNEESSAYWAARESLPWEKMAILYTSQICMPVLGYFSRYEIGNTILVSYEAITGTMFILDGIGMYNRSFVKNPALSATLKLLGGVGFLALAYYQHTEVGTSPPDSRFWKGYLAYQLFAIPIELYALTVEY